MVNSDVFHMALVQQSEFSLVEETSHDHISGMLEVGDIFPNSCRSQCCWFLVATFPSLQLTSSLKTGRAPKGNESSEPTIDFSELWLLVLGRLCI